MGEIAPRDCLEHSLQEIWEEVLGTAGIGICTSFLAAGGTIGLAEAMLDRVNEMVDVRVPLAAFLEEPTIERLAAAVDSVLLQRLPPSHETFAPALGGSDTARRLFLVSDGSAARLIRALGRRQQAHLLPLVTVDHPTLHSVEATAAACLRTLRQLQPRGPYRLAGFCLGACIAFEMACRLEREGETVERLILLAARPWSHRWFTRRFFAPIARLLGLDAQREVEAFVRLSQRIVGWEGQVHSYRGRGASC